MSPITHCDQSFVEKEINIRLTLTKRNIDVGERCEARLSIIIIHNDYFFLLSYNVVTGNSFALTNNADNA